MRKLACMSALVLLLLPVCGAAELSGERAAFYQARTEEWEAALGPYHTWNYDQRAMFCSIYHRLPGDYYNPEMPNRDDLPTLPTEDVLSYEEALRLTIEFLCSYDPRITEDALRQLHIASAYYDFCGDPQMTITRTAHVQCWFIQFGEGSDSDYIARCTVYLDGASGRICCLELGLDMENAQDWAHYQSITFP
ncbi:MAG: hypothetical protein IJA77_00275 [Clostridia bacterium]|nr:hypothetical protein [Clostridia bacterium]